LYINTLIIFFRYSALHPCCTVTSSGDDVTGSVEFVVIRNLERLNPGNVHM